MWRIAFSLGLIIFTSSLSAFADDANLNKYGISYGGSTGLAIRKALNENTLLYAGIGFGYGHYDNSSCCSDNSSNYTMTFGTRRFLAVDKLSKFIDVELIAQYVESRSSVSNSHGKGVSAFVAYGIEYFLSPNLSIEGKAGLSVNYFTSSFGGASNSQKSTNFPRAVTAITYYW